MIITCASSKGGVGKTTTVAVLAGAFAHIGRTVHIVDLDSNKTISRWYGDDKTRPERIKLSIPDDPQDLTNHLKKITLKDLPDIVLIDVAGSYERALTVAIARAHMTIIPVMLDEAAVTEANKTSLHIQQLFAPFNKEPLFRVLITQMDSILSHAEKHAAREIQRLRLPLFRNLLAKRAAYKEIGFSGLPPHYADAERPTVAKALGELNALREEIEALIANNHSPTPSKSAGAAR